MSFNRATYDPCAYEYDVTQSVRVGQYQLDLPANPAPCFYTDPHVRLQVQGVASCAPGDLVSVDSDMLGITRRYSRCPTDKFPAHEFRCNARMLPDCVDGGSWTEDTRLSNPPCTLRCTGWNRWAWLPCNPQDHALLRFQTLINTSIVVKDNHRPLLPTADDLALAGGGRREVPSEPTATWTDEWVSGKRRGEVQTMTTWRTCDEVRRL